MINHWGEKKKTPPACRTQWWSLSKSNTIRALCCRNTQSMWSSDEDDICISSWKTTPEPFWWDLMKCTFKAFKLKLFKLNTSVCMSAVFLQTEEKRMHRPHKEFVPFCIAQYLPHLFNKIKDNTILPMRPLRIVIHIYRLETHFLCYFENYLKSHKLGHSAHIETSGISKKKWLKKSSIESRILAEEQHFFKSWAVWVPFRCPIYRGFFLTAAELGLTPGLGPFAACHSNSHSLSYPLSCHLFS